MRRAAANTLAAIAMRNYVGLICSGRSGVLIWAAKGVMAPRPFRDETCKMGRAQCLFS
jgi:hypothetical protein